MRKIILLSSTILLSVGVGFGQSIELTPSGYDGKINSGSSTSPSLKLLHPISNGFSRINFENVGVTNKFMISGNVQAVAADSRWNIWHTSTGNIISVSGDGNVGIGVSSPNERFHVNGGDALIEDTTPFLEFRNTGDAGANGIRFESSSGASKASITYTPVGLAGTVRITSSGSGTSSGLFVANNTSTNNIGINEDDPQAYLHIRGNSVPSTPHLRFYENNSGLADNITFENFGSTEFWKIQAQSNNAVGFSKYVLNVTNTGDVVTYTGDGNAKHHGYTQLGDDAPKVKMKKITGTTLAGTATNIAHGLTRDKILAVDIHISNGAGVNYPPSGNGLASVVDQYRYFLNSVNLSLVDVGADLRSQSYWILITYEE
jgi:hypothetical protein